MEALGTINAFLTAIGFKASELTKRFLQEKGASEIDTYTVNRFALIPAIIWGLVFVRRADISYILDSHKLTVIFITIVVLWNLQALIISFIINSTSSMVLFTTIYSIFQLPFFLGFGTFFNGDTPNFFSISAILILLLAIFIKPTPHHENLRPHLSKPLVVIISLIFLKACCDTILDGVSREALKEIHPTVFLGIFSVPTLVFCALISKFYIYRRNKETSVMKDKRWIALLIPLVWFAASIPEAFAYAALPIYTVVSIGMLTFGMDTFSDVIHKRIHLNFRTISFLVLVLCGISLTILSI